MDGQKVVEQTKKSLKQTIDHFLEEIAKIRTGRANPSMLDSVVVQAYGTPMPIKQVASISAPEPQLLQITPFDPNNLDNISSAIRDDQSLGLNPMDDGRIVRIPIPPLTTERRQQIVKQLHEKLEQSMISLRNVRHDHLKDLDNLKNDKSLSEDEFNRYSEQIETEVKATKSEIEKISSEKETEIMTV